MFLFIHNILQQNLFSDMWNYDFDLLITPPSPNPPHHPQKLTVSLVVCFCYAYNENKIACIMYYILSFIHNSN